MLPPVKYAPTHISWRSRKINSIVLVSWEWVRIFPISSVLSLFDFLSSELTLNYVVLIAGISASKLTLLLRLKPSVHRYSGGPPKPSYKHTFNPLNPELNPICYLKALLGAHHFLHVSRIRVKLLIFRLLMSHIYGAPILDVSRSHTTTQHSR